MTILESWLLVICVFVVLFIVMMLDWERYGIWVSDWMWSIGLRRSSGGVWPLRWAGRPERLADQVDEWLEQDW